MNKNKKIILAFVIIILVVFCLWFFSLKKKSNVSNVSEQGFTIYECSNINSNDDYGTSKVDDIIKIDKATNKVVYYYEGTLITFNNNDIYNATISQLKNGDSNTLGYSNVAVIGNNSIYYYNNVENIDNLNDILYNLKNNLGLTCETRTDDIEMTDIKDVNIESNNQVNSIDLDSINCNIYYFDGNNGGNVLKYYLLNKSSQAYFVTKINVKVIKDDITVIDRDVAINSTLESGNPYMKELNLSDLLGNYMNSQVSVTCQAYGYVNN